MGCCETKDMLTDVDISIHQPKQFKRTHDLPVEDSDEECDPELTEALELFMLRLKAMRVKKAR